MRFGLINRLWDRLFSFAPYAWTLGSKAPLRLAAGPAEPWPGDAEKGALILAGQAEMDSEFSGLRDVRATGAAEAADVARRITLAWIEANQRFTPQGWRADRLGARLDHWTRQSDLLLGAAGEGFREPLLLSAARQARHLVRVLPQALSGYPLLKSIKGLFLWALASGDETLLARALGLLNEELVRQVHPDGGHISRSPRLQLALFQDLIDLKSWLKELNREIPDLLQQAIDRMAPMLRFFRHGDGALALFHDSKEGDPALIALALNLSGSRGRPMASAPHSRFERLTAGKCLVLFDAGPPVYDSHAHASALAFEMSVGKNRVVVNLGSADEEEPRWRLALKSTAAHSALSVAGRDSTEFGSDGMPSRKPLDVRCRRDEDEGAVWLETSHDGWKGPFGLLCKRRLHLNLEGTMLRGEDQLIGPAGHPFVIRFHLHPSVQASPVRDGEAILLKLADGQGWRFRAQGAKPDLAGGVYRGGADRPRRNGQIVLSGTTGREGAVVKWAFDAVPKRSG
jgi:uncharacterized heparinase superfamily protein